MTASFKNCTFLIGTMSSRSPIDNVAVKSTKQKIVILARASGDPGSLPRSAFNMYQFPH